MFDCIDHQAKTTLCILPAWGFHDVVYRNIVPKDVNLIVYKPPHFQHLDRDLSTMLTLFPDTSYIALGLSLGGFLLAHCSLAVQASFSQLIFWGIRASYPKENIYTIKRYLKQAPSSYMKAFYQQCFSQGVPIRNYGKRHQTRPSQEKPRRLLAVNEDIFPRMKHSTERFTTVSIASLLERIDLSYLIQGLDFLLHHSLTKQGFHCPSTSYIVHGEYDNIAPLCEAKTLAEQAKVPFFTRKGEGHLPYHSPAWIDDVLSYGLATK